MTAREIAADMPEAATVVVSTRDLVEAWAALEKLVVSFRKIGSEFAVEDVEDGRSLQTTDRHTEMLDAIHDFLRPEVVRELARARGLLAKYLPDEETESMSENLISYWDANPRAGT